MSRSVDCDFCGDNLVEHSCYNHKVDARYVVRWSSEEILKFEVDLCDKCFGELYEFIQKKTNAHK